MSEVNRRKLLSTLAVAPLAGLLAKFGIPQPVREVRSVRIARLMNETSARLAMKAVESLDNDPQVQAKIREMVLRAVEEVLYG